MSKKVTTDQLKDEQILIIISEIEGIKLTKKFDLLNLQNLKLKATRQFPNGNLLVLNTKLMLVASKTQGQWIKKGGDYHILSTYVNGEMTLITDIKEVEKEI